MNIKPSPKLPQAECHRITRRACAAYLTEDPRGWPDGDPANARSGVVRRQGLNYVVLYDAADQLLAVYRVRHDRKLQRVAELPE